MKDIRKNVYEAQPREIQSARVHTHTHTHTQRERERERERERDRGYMEAHIL